MYFTVSHIHSYKHVFAVVIIIEIIITFRESGRDREDENDTFFVRAASSSFRRFRFVVLKIGYKVFNKVN